MDSHLEIGVSPFGPSAKTATLMHMRFLNRVYCISAISFNSREAALRFKQRQVRWLVSLPHQIETRLFKCSPIRLSLPEMLQARENALSLHILSQVS